MVQENPVTKKRRRVPKPGTGFTLLRVLGIIMMVSGLLVIVGSGIGLVIILVRLGPTLLEILSAPSLSQMGGFVLILYLGWVCIPLVTGLAGIFLLAIGFVFHRLSTRPANQ